MGSLHETRYCSRGQRCRGYDDQTDKPQKLRRTSESDICEYCKQAPSEEESAVSAEPREGERLPTVDAELEAHKNALGVRDLTVLKSSAVAELRRPQENLLVEHCLRRGSF